ncbi:NAD(P)/FAD-dependent oxidoreductase [Campylobacter troglodytis]|nr:NAD(P)/FAD-dependent oxidoreductase [Campylobacter troglodytis]
MPQNPKILIIGGGYAGLRVAISLSKLVDFSSNKPEITLISKHDYHYQTTLLHKVAAGTLSERKARIYYRKILDPQKVKFTRDKIIELKPEQNQVVGNGGSYDYDLLIIALGFRPNSFNVPGVDEYAFRLASLNTALELRRAIEDRFKNFVLTKNELDLNIAVCGAGLAGIEFAAEMANELDELCAISGIDRSVPKLYCIDMVKRILPMLSDNLSQKATQKLESRGVTLLLESVMKEVQKDGVIIEKDGERKKIEANTVLWCAGVKGSEVVEKSSLANKGGRIEVDYQLRANQFDNIFVVGDSAFPTTKEAMHPPTAQLAAQMGDFVALLLSEELKGNSFSQGFKFNKRGTVCSLGHTDAVGSVYDKDISGELAALVKNTIENKWVFGIGGLPMVFKKGQFRYRTSN